jgi:hypothetical protein
MSTRCIPPDRAKVTLIDRSDPDNDSVSLLWTDAANSIDSFDLASLGTVKAVQGDLLATPPRGWVMLEGRCRRRFGYHVKLLTTKRK